MTGKKPGKHGTFHFIELFENDGLRGDKPKIVNARNIKSSTLWDILSHHDRKLVLINIPMTYPPRPVNGTMIACFLTPRNAPVFTYPPELSKQLTDYVIDLDRFIDTKPFQGDSISAEITAPTLSLVAEFRDMTDKRAKTSLSLMDSNPWDLFMVVFASPDRMGHYLWPFHRDPSPDDSPEVQQLCQAVRDHYIRLDQVVGELVERAGEGVSILVMSDHGMGLRFSKRLHLNSWLQQHGWLLAKGAGTAAFNADSWARRLRLPRDKIGRIVHRIPGMSKSRLVGAAARSRSAIVDREKSQAYCLPMYNHVMGIRLNASGQSKEALRQEIMRELEKIVDPETGVKVVQQVIQGEDYYYGSYALNIPDILVVLHPDYGCGTELGTYSSVITKMQMAPRQGGHRLEGIFIASGPHIVADAEPLSDLDIEDIAPTVLHLMDLPIPNDMDGRVLNEILTPSTLASRPVKMTEPLGFWPSEDEAVFSDDTVTDEDEEKIRERLQALGYLE
jgi:predicted AlkP superfamily phosphohydrolase/phosphomutase